MHGCDVAASVGDACASWLWEAGAARRMHRVGASALAQCVVDQRSPRVKRLWLCGAVPPQPTREERPRLFRQPSDRFATAHAHAPDNALHAPRSSIH